jgi:hypothetical protein
MQREIASAIAVTTVLLAAAGAARSQTDPPGTLDHLLCYKIKDAFELSASVDMMTELQPEFARRGCKLTNPVEFCVPASKRKVDPPVANPDLFGQTLRDDYICYRAECEDDAKPAERTGEDQFGSRPIGRFRAQKVCVPARKHPIPCGPVGRRTCGGICPADQSCAFDKVTKSCGCAPTPCGGKPDERGTCGGSCPPDQQCRPDADNRCACQPLNPPACGVIPGPVLLCGGSCADPTAVCLPGAAGCTCQPATPMCGLDRVTGACGGACLSPEETCRSGPAGACSCQPLPTGPVSTYFGVASAAGVILQPSAVENGVPVYEPTPPFYLFAEFDKGASQAPVGDDGTKGQELPPGVAPDLQAWVGVALGTGLGLGSPQVCDDGNPSGELIGGVPASADFSNTDALQDFACRFDVRLVSDEACTVDQFDLPRFASMDTLKQFCVLIDPALAFQSGDTPVHVRAADITGVVGNEAQLIIRRP